VVDEPAPTTLVPSAWSTCTVSAPAASSSEPVESVRSKVRTAGVPTSVRWTGAVIVSDEDGALDGAGDHGEHAVHELAAARVVEVDGAEGGQVVRPQQRPRSGRGVVEETHRGGGAGGLTDRDAAQHTLV